MADTQVQTLMKIAKAEVGYKEGGGRSNNNNQKYSDEVPGLEWSDFQPWCDTFVHWVAFKGGVLNLWPDVNPSAKGGSASCDTTRNAWRKIGRYSEYPAIGSQVFYGTPSDSNHTGFVVDYDGTSIWAVEGNTNDTGSREGDGVYLKKRLRTSANVLGYGYPAYREGIKSADPTWASGFKGNVEKEETSLALRVDGVDLSHWNTVTLEMLKAFKSGGGRWVSHKVTEHDTYIDPTYAARRKLVRAAGLPFGAYHFARPAASSALKQAEWFLKNAKIEPGDFRPMLDLEDDGGKSKAALTDWVDIWMSKVKAEVGVMPLLYNKFDLDETLGAMLWVARYHPENKDPVIPHPWGRWRIRQFSNGDSGVPNRAPGLGAVDLNVMRETPMQSILGFMVPAKDAVPAPVVKSTGRTTRVTGHTNIQGTDKFPDTKARIDEMVAATSSFTVNELATLQMQQYAMDIPGWNCYLPGSNVVGRKVTEQSDASRNAILWDSTKFKAKVVDHIVLHKGVKGMTEIRTFAWVVLEDLSNGKQFSRAVTHLVQNIEEDGKWRSPELLAGQNERGKLGVATITSKTRELAAMGSGFASGDLNVDYNRDRERNLAKTGTKDFPYAMLSKVARISKPNRHGPTHGDRLIDWGWCWGSLYVLDSKVGNKDTSDHSDIRWTIEY